jgi:hypothetical protein
VKCANCGREYNDCNGRCVDLHGVPLKIWRCFHCDEVFADEESARRHFGDDERAEAGCILKLTREENAILACLREAEDRNRRLMHRAAEAEFDGEANAGLRAELKRLFGVSDAWACWCKLDSAEGRIIAFEVQRRSMERLAGAVCAMIDRDALDARSEAADALLDYASLLYGDERPIETVRERYADVRPASRPANTERASAHSEG